MRAKTAVFETRCDLRSLAMIASYLHSVGIPCSTKSSIGTAVIEGFADRLSEKGYQRPVSTEEAQSILFKLGISLTQRERRARAALQDQIDLEEALTQKNKPTGAARIDAKRIARELLE